MISADVDEVVVLGDHTVNIVGRTLPEEYVWSDKMFLGDTIAGRLSGVWGIGGVLVIISLIVVLSRAEYISRRPG